VRGISLKLQEEERERRMDYVPERSALDRDSIDIDASTKKMLDELLGRELPNTSVPERSRHNRGRRDNNRGGNQ
jgi:small subunit ribosomal protein S17e